ncbi:hypothetical protein [Xanthobacter sp. YC-JY1]|uniref:hypothetical protein n=1 Tax=Xanthobacter sp. YC-JY1 TaxID=2419844 RepID=UPI001F207FD5|nr:hypothetical protein [Xanthobacter sp. YC-JY1]
MHLIFLPTSAFFLVRIAIPELVSTGACCAGQVPDNINVRRTPGLSLYGADENGTSACFDIAHFHQYAIYAGN